MHQSHELSQRMLARAKELNPLLLGSSSLPASIPVNVAVEIADQVIKEMWFEPKGDNHHNAMACPYCRNGTTLVAVDPKLVEKFIDPTKPWTVEDEKNMIEAFRYALEHYN